VSPQATALPGTATTRQYQTFAITCTRRFLAVSTRNEPFQDSRPPLDAVPITVPRKTLTLLRCLLPPIPTDSVFDTISSPICATFVDYGVGVGDVMIFPLWERHILLHPTDDPFPVTPLYRLLLKGIHPGRQRLRPREELRLIR
jgi:hypothetical protein